MTSTSLLEDIERLNERVRIKPPHKLIAFEPALVPMLKPRDTDQVYFDHIPNFTQVLAGYAQIGYAHMGISRGKPVCMFGCVPLWAGVAELWMITDVNLGSSARTFHRVTKEMFDIYMSELSLVRLQIWIHSQNERAIKWAKALYFEDEGIARNFGPDGADFHLLARLSHGRNNRRTVFKTKTTTSTSRSRSSHVESPTGTGRKARSAGASKPKGNGGTQTRKTNRRKQAASGRP